MFKISIDHKIFQILLFCIIYVCLIGCGVSKHKRAYDADLIDKKTVKTANAQIGKKVVKAANSQIGKKYCFGGESPRKGFDCSGLIWWAYDRHDVSVPRVTKDQARYGRGVSLRYIRQGDIVVFRTRRGPHGLHTGIYTGKNKFIHSPKAGERVRTESLSNAYWSKRLIAVRRYVK